MRGKYLPQTVLQVRSLEGGGAKRLVNRKWKTGFEAVMRLDLSLASLTSRIEVRKTLLLGTLRLEQLGLLVFAFLKRKYLYLFYQLLTNERVLLLASN